MVGISPTLEEELASAVINASCTLHFLDQLRECACWVSRSSAQARLERSSSRPKTEMELAPSTWSKNLSTKHFGAQWMTLNLEAFPGANFSTALSKCMWNNGCVVNNAHSFIHTEPSRKWLDIKDAQNLSCKAITKAYLYPLEYMFIISTTLTSSSPQPLNHFQPKLCAWYSSFTISHCDL